MNWPSSSALPWSMHHSGQGTVLDSDAALLAGADAQPASFIPVARRERADGWIRRAPKAGVRGAEAASPAQGAGIRVLEGESARALDSRQKWDLLSPFLRQHGREGIAYATLQSGMEYFIGPSGYIAYTRARHPLWARRPRRIVFSDPICAPEDVPALVGSFLAQDRHAAFGVISEACARALRPLGFKVNCIGYEPLMAVQTYNTEGNWKELDLIKRARNEARREGLTIREESGMSLKQRRRELKAFSARWVRSRKINDREIWLYARRPVFEPEEGVRKFVAYDPERRVAGFAFYDPMYRGGRVFGYSANIVRCDERRFGRLATALHMVAMETFRAEGVEVLNLLLAPFGKLECGAFNDDWAARQLFRWSARFGNGLYNFQGLSFHKSKYRGAERPLYFASNGWLPCADVYLAFASAGIADGCWGMLRKLLRGWRAAGGGRG
ncbi:MAG TPA: DUF2156 domain-containing protein, partial [Verrucomicrobiota bacterium]|nr:DUF2156 domain-containing protein [Verrucomicrobiota bacterium]